MDWRNESIWELRNLEAKRASIADIQTQIREFDLRMKAVRSATSDATPVSGGGSGREDMLLNWVTEKDALAATLAVVRLQIELIERALQALSDEDREILELCYIRARSGTLNQLCERLQCEVATVYRRRNRALRNYTIRRRGMMEI